MACQDRWRNCQSVGELRAWPSGEIALSLADNRAGERTEVCAITNRAPPARVAIGAGERLGFRVVRAWSPAPMPSDDPIQS